MFGIGPNAAGHDASRAPVVPEPLLRIDYDSEDPGVIFTWKSEFGHPPYVILHVPPGWRRDIVHPGWAVLGRHPVLRIDERDTEGRPVRVLAVMVTGHYDGGMHGWRATGFAVPRGVEWEPDGTARIVRDSNDPVW